MTSTPTLVHANYSLSRLTTVRTGGAADFFARVSSVNELQDLLIWATEQNLDVSIVGSGSNMLISDVGVRGLVMKLESSLAQIERRDNHLICGGGVRLPSAAAYSARAGLSGIEFGVNIPGTVGGAVKMNANAYGGQLEEVLSWVEIVTVEGVRRRQPAEFEFTYRHSNLQSFEVVSAACFELVPTSPAEVKETLAAMREKRRSAQPSGIKTFGSTFKNPASPKAEGRTAGQLLEAAGCRGLQVGGAKFSDKHANFVENTGDATTAQILELMAEGCRRVREQFGVQLEAEVQVLGEVDWKLEAKADATTTSS